MHERATPAISPRFPNALAAGPSPKNTEPAYDAGDVVFPPNPPPPPDPHPITSSIACITAVDVSAAASSDAPDTTDAATLDASSSFAVVALVGSGVGGGTTSETLSVMLGECVRVIEVSFLLFEEDSEGERGESDTLADAEVMVIVDEVESVTDRELDPDDVVV